MITIERIKQWLVNEIEANKKYGDDPTNTAEDLLGLIKIWELEELQQDKLGTSINIFSTNKVN